MATDPNEAEIESNNSRDTRPWRRQAGVLVALLIGLAAGLYGRGAGDRPVAETEVPPDVSEMIRALWLPPLLAEQTVRPPLLANTAPLSPPLIAKSTAPAKPPSAMAKMAEPAAGWLGMSCVPIPSQNLHKLGLTRASALVVALVYPGGPAARAGLRQGDILLSVNGEPLVTETQLSVRARKLGVGGTVTVEVFRSAGETFSAPLAVAPAPSLEELTQVVKEAAEAGDPAFEYLLGYLYGSGQGLAQSDEQALRWFRRSAKQGYAEGQLALSGMYYHGRAVNKDYKMALSWLRRAAEQNHAESQYWLGTLYMSGAGKVLARDSGEAFFWFRRAADNGSAKAMSGLGWLYEKGQGVQKNAGKAAEWYRKAAALGDATAEEGLQRLGG